MKKIIFRNKECFICDERVKNQNRNNNYNYYELRHGDEDFSLPETIENKVIVNFWGTLATKEEIKLDNEWSKDRFESELTKQEKYFLASEAASNRNGYKINEDEIIY